MRPKQTHMLTEPFYWYAKSGERVWGPARAKWDGQPKRAPKAGEYYISGANPVAYRAKHDLTQEFFIAVLY